MKKIAFISTIAWNYFFPGTVSAAGGNTRIYNLCRKFAQKKEYEVYCITGDFGQPDMVEKEGVKLVRAPVGNPLAIFSVMKIIHGIKPDLLIDCCASPRLFVLYLLKKIAGIKYVFLTGSDNDVNGDYRFIENHFYYCAYWWGLKHADAVISQVPFHKRMLKKRYHLESFLVLSPYLEVKPHTPHPKDSVLWVGRAAYYKRPELFVDLAEAFPCQKFVMICNPSDYDRGFMDRFHEKCFRIHNLEFHEYIPYQDIAGFYQRAKVLVNTSDFEGFSNTFIEAAVNYTPVLSFNSNPNDMLSEYGCGYVCDGRFYTLKELLAKMLADENLRVRLGENSFNYAFQFHQMDNAVNAMDSIFQGVA